MALRAASTPKGVLSAADRNKGFVWLECITLLAFFLIHCFAADVLLSAVVQRCWVKCLQYMCGENE